MLDGNYDGDVGSAELQEHGDFGLGTLDALDGEMIALDGSFYQVRSDGRAYPVDGGDEEQPFAVVTVFEPELCQTLDAATDLAGLCAIVDGLLGDDSICCAVRVDAGASSASGHEACPASANLTRHSWTWSRTSPSSDLSGVRAASLASGSLTYAQGLNVAGYRFHLITADRSAGGHVLQCRLTGGELRVDHEADLRVELPSGRRPARTGPDGGKAGDVGPHRKGIAPNFSISARTVC